MDSKRKYCPNDCNLRAYYVNQAGSGFHDIRTFRGHPYQAGYGLGSIFSKYGIPVLRFLGKHLLYTGMALGSDVLARKNLRESVRQRVKEGTKTAAKEGLNRLSDLVDQAGSGKLYKPKQRKRKVTKKTKSKRTKKDIFS